MYMYMYICRREMIWGQSGEVMRPTRVSERREAKEEKARRRGAASKAVAMSGTGEGVTLVSEAKSEEEARNED